MIRSFISGLVLALALPIAIARAASDEVVIASGRRGGTYHDIYGANLVVALPAFKARQRTTDGSGENLDLLARGRADIGFAQLDVYAALLRGDRARYEKLGVIGRLDDECVFVAHRRQGPIHGADSLKAMVDGRKPVLAVGENSGGMHLSWLFIVELDPAYDATAIRFTPGTLAINHLATGMVDAVAWITDPANPNHKLQRAVRADASLGLMGLADPGLAHALPNGTPVYELRTLSLPNETEPGTLDTICTSSMIFTRSGADPKLVEAVSDVLSLEREKLLGRR